MARVRLTRRAQRDIESQGLTLAEVIQVIGDYDRLEEDLYASGLIRASGEVTGRRIWVTYRAGEDSLLVLTVDTGGTGS